MKNAFHGDFGYSLAQQKPVLTLFNQYIWNSFLLAIVSTFLTWLIAVVVGVVAAYKQYSWFDTMVMVAIFAAMSIPSFFIGLVPDQDHGRRLEMASAGRDADDGQQRDRAWLMSRK